MLELLKLYGVFFKLGCVNFGGGYALLPLLQKDLVEKRGWATEDEIADYYAIGQCTPGAIAVNVSSFIGYRRKGVLGAIFSTLGFISPAFIIIFIIATVLNHFAEYETVQSAFKAIRVCVFVLVLSAVIKLAKKSIVDKITLLIAVIVMGLTIFTPIPLFVYVILAGTVGFFVGLYRDKKVEKEPEKPIENQDESSTSSSDGEVK